MKVSLITTVLNEEKTIKGFLASIFSQSKKPDEIIIVDGGSTDNTIAEISSFKFDDQKLKIKLIFKKGNRSVGRNEAIKKASNEIIACSDAGCVLDKDWLKNIIEPFKDSRVDVVAGYYKADAKTIFQKCLAPYVLVMPDKVNEKEFLPATRSMAFKKSIWKKAGELDEKYSHNEDYVFAHKLKNIKAHIVFVKKAIANWIPRNNFKEAFRMFFRFALGDSESGILRGKILLLFARYVLFFYSLLLAAIERSVTPLYITGFGLFSYVIWSIKKNYKYVQDAKAFFFLPLIQFTSDFAVIAGTVLGLLKKINIGRICSIIENNKLVSLIIGAYALTMITLLNWGIPNLNHPFNYFMDEWHQAQAVRAVFTQGSPNVPGSANGSMFHFLLSGLMLIPFIVTGFIDPFLIKSSVGDLEMQQRLFQALRLNTLFFGVASIILIVYIAKKYLKLNPFIVSFLFVVNPIWITLSNYFKYDIALVFWILLSFLFLLRYLFKSSLSNYLLAAFFSGIALSVKVSAIPLLPILITAFILNKDKKDLRQLLAGIMVFAVSFLLFGIPDLLLGKGNINEYLYDNLVRTPNYSSNYILNMPYWTFVLTRGIPTVFGNFLTIISFFGLIFLFGQKRTIYIFITISLLLFILSLIPLKIEARGNRLLVLLPFITLISGIFLDKLIYLARNYLRKIIIFILLLLFLLQGLEVFGWISLKTNKDPREISSIWIKENIPVGSKIAIENIPIYQSLPNIILKDYYLGRSMNSRYGYDVVNNLYGKSYSYIIVTNEETKNYIEKSLKRDFIQSINTEKYKKIYSVRQNNKLLSFFSGDLDYFMSGLVQSPLSISIYQSPKGNRNSQAYDNKL